MKPSILIILLISISLQISAQQKPACEIFWESLTKHCGKSYEGMVITPISENDPFAGKKLVMHVVDCGDGFIHIPFFVGEDKSRTWVLTTEDGLITLKHTYRHEDGSADKVTQYGGTSIKHRHGRHTVFSRRSGNGKSDSRICYQCVVDCA